MADKKEHPLAAFWEKYGLGTSKIVYSADAKNASAELNSLAGTPAAPQIAHSTNENNVSAELNALAEPSAESRELRKPVPPPLPPPALKILAGLVAAPKIAHSPNENNVPAELTALAGPSAESRELSKLVPPPPPPPQAFPTMDNAHSYNEFHNPAGQGSPSGTPLEEALKQLARPAPAPLQPQISSAFKDLSVPIALPAAASPASAESVAPAVSPAVGAPMRQAQTADSSGYKPDPGFYSLISPTARKGMNEALLQEGGTNLDAAKAQEDAAGTAHKIRLAARSIEQDDLNKQLGEAEGRYLSAQNEVEKARKLKETSDADVSTAIEEVKNAGIDPGRFFINGGIFGGITLALNSAMGAFWSAFTNQNPAQEIINDAIKRDIAAQESELQNKKSTADFALKRNLAKTGDLTSAKELTRLQQLTLISMQAEKMKFEGASAVEDSNYALVAAGLHSDVAKAAATYTMSSATFRMKSEARVPATNSTNSSASIKDFLKQEKDDRERYIPGYGLVASATEKTQITAAMTNFETAASLYKQLLPLVKDRSFLNRAGAWVWPTETSEKIAGIASALAAANSALNLQGAIQKAEKDAAYQQVGDATSITQSSEVAVAYITSLLARTQDQEKRFIKQRGVMPADVREVPVPINDGRRHFVYLPKPLTKDYLEGATPSEKVSPTKTPTLQRTTEE